MANEDKRDSESLEAYRLRWRDAVAMTKLASAAALAANVVWRDAEDTRDARQRQEAQAKEEFLARAAEEHPQ